MACSHRQIIAFADQIDDPVGQVQMDANLGETAPERARERGDKALSKGCRTGNREFALGVSLLADDVDGFISVRDKFLALFEKTRQRRSAEPCGWCG
jgi:hypothetical protein